MPISAMEVRFDDNSMWVTLNDGRTIGVPLAWFPRLLRAEASEREDFEITPFGLHWKSLNEDISISGLLAGQGDMTSTHDQVA